MKPLFCGNLRYDTDKSDLHRLFSEYGKVNRVVMKSGFAFVYFDDEHDAEDAIQGLNNKPLGNSKRRLSVEWSKGGRYEGSRSMANPRPTRTLFVTNFDAIHTSTQDIERHFEPFGKILNVRMRGHFAFVNFETHEEATDALKNTNRSKILGSAVTVEYARVDDGERGDRPGSPQRRYVGHPYGRSRSPPNRRSRRSPDYGRARSPAYDRHTGPSYRRDRSPDYSRYPSRSSKLRSKITCKEGSSSVAKESWC